MPLSSTDIGLTTAFSLFVCVHIGIIIAVIWHIFCAWDEEKTGRITNKDTELSVRPVCLGAASNSGLDFSSISSSVPGTDCAHSKLFSKQKCLPFL